VPIIALCPCEKLAPNCTYVSTLNSDKDDFLDKVVEVRNKFINNEFTEIPAYKYFLDLSANMHHVFTIIRLVSIEALGKQFLVIEAKNDKEEIISAYELIEYLNPYITYSVYVFARAARISINTKRSTSKFGGYNIRIEGVGPRDHIDYEKETRTYVIF
jgi:hypothetical protein